MGKRTEPLTADELALTASTRDEWMQIGLSTEPIDRDEATQAVLAVYRAAGLDDPAIVHMSSPAGVAVAAWVFRSSDAHQLGVQLGVQLGGQLGGQLGDQLGVQLGVQLRGQLGGQLRDQLGGQLGGQLRGQLRDQLRGQAWDLSRWQVWGAWESYWLALYDLGLRLSGDCPERLKPQLDAMLQAARSSGTWFPMHGICVIGDRPTVLNLDNRGFLHAEDGPAVRYADGWESHRWHGTQVPEWVITDPTLDKITAEPNTEIRRCAIESYGWDRYLADLGATPISVEDDPGNPGHTLSLYELPDKAQVHDASVRLLVMDNASRDRDGTRRRFAETVPMECRTAIDAAAWQWDVTPEEYRLIERAT